jgi:uncharacterized protein YoxC
MLPTVRSEVSTPVWIILVLALSVLGNVVNAAFSFHLNEQFRTLSENHSRLLENHKALHGDLEKLTETTKEKLKEVQMHSTSVQSDLAKVKNTADNAQIETAKNTAKLEPVKEFRQSGGMFLAVPKSSD